MNDADGFESAEGAADPVMGYEAEDAELEQEQEPEPEPEPPPAVASSTEAIAEALREANTRIMGLEHWRRMAERHMEETARIFHRMGWRFSVGEVTDGD